MKIRKGKKKGRKMSPLFPVILIKGKTFNIKKNYVGKDTIVK